MSAPLLVLGVGNPSRGDDALGPLFVERLSEQLAHEVSRQELELLTDFQLQIEHALDLSGREQVVFVDASVQAAPPFEYERVLPSEAAASLTHALSPGAVLATHRRLVGEPPPAWVLAIRGERFELGDPLSPHARAHLEAALEFFVTRTQGAHAKAQGRRIELEGTVQGVGMRPFVYRAARALGLTGMVKNTARGVCIEAHGQAQALQQLLLQLQHEAPEAAEIRGLTSCPIAFNQTDGFHIIPSCPGPRAALTLPPDQASCQKCLDDVADSSSRYHGYAFTSCMTCGPRLAIATALPYDRNTTTMAAFARCPACEADYEDPNNRRFHAQTVACAQCGPRAWLADASGVELATTDAIIEAAEWLRSGKVIAVQGVGAIHLSCDAMNPNAVQRLRQAKQRDAQPFAVMVRDLQAAETLVVLDSELRAALISSARPIVLAPARPRALPDVVNGSSQYTGVMLPYTPLHQVLLSSVEGPLVMTSGNPSRGPALIDEREARAELAGIADAFLLHDRAIARRVEDSVVASAHLGVRPVRRSRGMAPTPIQLPRAAPEPILAVGGHLKNTACLVVGDQAYLTPHLGDLEFEASKQAWQRDVEGFERLLGVRAQVLAHDLHPEYTSTRYALERPAKQRIGVQHHVAHVLATAAELKLEGPLLGVAFDGSGYGTDATAWGGEFLLVDGDRWTRALSVRPLPLPGGERAIREVWRVALGSLVEAFGAERALRLAAELPSFRGLSRNALSVVSQMLARGTGIVRARGIGRYYDAVGALLLGYSKASFEAEVAIALERATDSGPADIYPVSLPQTLAIGEPFGEKHEIDFRPTLRALVGDLLQSVPVGRIAARFQSTLVHATLQSVAAVLNETGVERVVLTGGSFQNRGLERELSQRLGASTLAVARQIPVNDGGLALGQAWAATLALTRLSG